jgi:hypothetical protein
LHDAMATGNVRNCQAQSNATSFGFRNTHAACSRAEHSGSSSLHGCIHPAKAIDLTTCVLDNARYRCLCTKTVPLHLTWSRIEERTCHGSKSTTATAYPGAQKFAQEIALLSIKLPSDDDRALPFQEAIYRGGCMFG